jgi:hypothetical protein
MAIINAYGHSEWNKNMKLATDNKTNEVLSNMAEWKKVEALFVKFEKPGDEFSGKLIAIEEGKSFGNQIYRFDKAGKTYLVSGTSTIESQMQGVAIGSMVKFVYTGTKDSKVKGHQAIKLIDVYVQA